MSTATAKWAKLNAREEINNLTDRLNEVGGGYGLGKDFVLKASLYLTQELPIQYRVKNFTRENLRKIEDNWENVKTYLAATVRLVRKFGYRWENVVAPLALLPISFWLMKGEKHSLDKSSKREDVKVQSEIRKWLGIALLKKSFSGSSDTTLRSLREALLKVTSSNTFPSAQLNAALGIDSISDAEIEDLLMEKYRGKYSYLVLSLLYRTETGKIRPFTRTTSFQVPSSGLSSCESGVTIRKR